MKKRFSQEASENSITRAEWYNEKCNEILYQSKIELQIDGQKVYTIKDQRKTLLIEVTNPKTIWFEIWLKLTNK